LRSSALVLPQQSSLLDRETHGNLSENSFTGISFNPRHFLRYNPRVSTMEDLMDGNRQSLMLIALVLLCIPFSTELRASSRLGPSSLGHETRVEATLARHLDGERIASWLDTLAPGTLEHEAAEWILAWLPHSDLALLDLPLLREHVEIAAASYREAPWREELPRELWLHYIVPHRVSQEPAQPWRRVIREELWPRVKDAATMEEAALAVNRWCREQATFKSTSGRDQGPLTTMARGIGRCEEEMILTICALRAVGIPARSCATPYWSFTDNNHAWVETWADGRWWYLGGCEPDRCLDRAWFTNSARRTGFVRSVGYGEFDPAPEPLYRAEDGSTLVNTTGVYTEPIYVTATLGGRFADAEQQEIHVNVLNFGSLRPVARFESGTTIALGPGEYAFTAGSEDELLLEVAGGRSGDTVAITLDESDRYDLAASPGFWLRYPESDARPARDEDLVSDEEDARLNRAIARRDGDRAKLRTPDEAERALLEALPEDQRTRFEAALELPFERASTLFLLLERYPDGAGREDLLAFLDACDDKDLLELGEVGVRSHIDGARAVRRRLETVGLALPDSIYTQGILPCRIAREPGGPWRDALPLLPLATDAQGSLLTILDAWTAGTELAEVGFFGAPLDPAQCWALGLGGERDLQVGLVGLLRRNGFPARWRHGKVEAWLGEWQGLDAEAGRVIEPESEGGEESGTGMMDIVITRGGEPYPTAESYRHFNVARPEDGWLASPWWDPRQGEQEWDAGEFVLCSANRVPGGSIYGRLRGFTVKAGESTRVELPLDLGPGWDPEGVFTKDLPWPHVLNVLHSMQENTGGGRAALSSIHEREDCLIFVYEAGEPATRMLDALVKVRDRLRNAGVTILFVAAGERIASETLTSTGFAPHLYGEVYHRHFTTQILEVIWQDSHEFWETVPLVILKLDDEIRYYRSGFNTSVDQDLHMVMDLLGSADAP